VITNGKVLKWSEPVEQAYANATDRIIVNVARHLRSGKAIHTAKWETQKLSEMGQLTAENARIIRDALRQMPKQVRESLDDTAKESLRLVDEAIEEAIRTGAIERSPISSTQGVIDELSQQALDQMNLVNSTMLESSQKAYLKCVNDTVRWENSMLSEQQTQAALETLNDATTAVLSGGETRTLALRRAIKELNAAGLYGFVDKRGRHWSPEAYVNMCMRTTVHNVAVRSVQARQQDYGSSIFQCSYHPASRPEHYPFQNKFYSWDGTSGTFTDGMGGKHQYESVTVTGYGTAAGLFGINCGHFPLPQIPGVTVPSDPDMQSAETDARQYKESQEQRQLERNIRLSKRLEEAYKAAGDDVGAAEAGMRTRLEQARMREFIDRTGRVRRYDREQISGYGPDKLVRPKKVTPPAPKVSYSTRDVEKRMVDKGVAQKVFLSSSIPAETAQRIEKTLVSLKEEGYPTIRGVIYDAKACAQRGAAAFYDHRTNCIYIGKRFLNGPSELVEIFKKAEDRHAEEAEKKQWKKYGDEAVREARKILETNPKGYEERKALENLKFGLMLQGEAKQATVCGSIEDVLRHEYGHAMHLMSEIRVPNTDRTGTGWAPNTTRKSIVPYEGAAELGAYALENPLEAVAEAFAAKRKGQKLPKFYEDLLDQIDKKVKK